MSLKIIHLLYIKGLCQYRLCKADHSYLTYLILQRQLSHLNGRKLDRRQVYAPYIFYVWLRLAPCCSWFCVTTDCCLHNFVLSRNGSWSSLYSLGMDRTENTTSNSSSIVGWRRYQRGPHRKHRSFVACAIVVMLMSLLCRNLETALFWLNYFGF
jgi:hypothetical protein